MTLHRRKGDKMTPMSLIKAIGIAIGLIGGTVTVGDRLWADKATVAKIETKVENIEEDVKEIRKMQRVVYDAFMEAAKYTKK